MAEKQAQTLPEKVVDLAGFAQTLIKHSVEQEKIIEKQAATAKRVGELAKVAAQALLENGRIEPHEKAAAELALQDPISALEILTNTAMHRNGHELASLGQPLNPEKKAGVNGNGHKPISMTTGARTSELRESDRNLFGRYGITPTE